MQDGSTGSVYRPSNNDDVHIYLFFLTASIFALFGGFDIAVRPFGVISNRGLHLICLAVCGLLGGSVVLEFRYTILSARWMAMLIVTSDVLAAILPFFLPSVRLRTGHLFPVSISCFGVSCILALCALGGMRGPRWASYVVYVRSAGLLAF